MEKSTVSLILLSLMLSACQSTGINQSATAPIALAERNAANQALRPSVDSSLEVETPDVHARKEAFIQDSVKKYALPEALLRDALHQAQYKQSIVNAMAKPAEATRTWAQYRPIFLNTARIQQGRDYLSDNRAALDQISAESGVPAEIILAIMGVETGWGKNMGNYRVLDALYTLAFYYPSINGQGNPQRSAFFSDELAQFIVLSQEEHLDLFSVKGSYAGAMGLGQFMPSSYRRYAKDGDGDGQRDLFTSKKDAFASIANYFTSFGWQTNQPIFMRAQASPEAVAFKPDNWEPQYRMADLQQKGYSPMQAIADVPLTLLTLDGAQGAEYWLGFKNFWVITRYNRSPLYAMAVYQLAQEIAQTPYNLPTDVEPTTPVNQP